MRPHNSWTIRSVDLKRTVSTRSTAPYPIHDQSDCRAAARSSRSLAVVSTILAMTILNCPAATGAMIANGATFVIDTSSSELSLSGTVTRLSGAGVPVTGAMLPQGTLDSITASLSGTLTATIGFSGITPTTIEFTGAAISPENSGSWNPGNYAPDDPNTPANDESYGGSEPAQWGWSITNFFGATAAIRGAELSLRSGAPAAVDRGGSFAAINSSLAFTGGTLDLDGSGFGKIVHADLADELFRFEENDTLLDPNTGQPYPGDIAWRDIVANNPGTGQPIYGDLAPAFSDGALDFIAPDPADAVVVFNADGNPEPAVFAHNGGDATLTTTPIGGPGGDDVNLRLSIPYAGEAAFYLDDLLWELSFFGTIEADALGVDALPYQAGDLNDDGIVNGLDTGFVKINFNRSVPPYTNGDITGDGFVNGLDVNVIAMNFNTRAPAVAAGPTAVPEPTAIVLSALVLGGLWPSAGRRRRLC